MIEIEITLKPVTKSDPLPYNKINRKVTSIGLNRTRSIVIVLLACVQYYFHNSNWLYFIAEVCSFTSCIVMRNHGVFPSIDCLFLHPNYMKYVCKTLSSIFARPKNKNQTASTTTFPSQRHHEPNCRGAVSPCFCDHCKQGAPSCKPPGDFLKERKLIRDGGLFTNSNDENINHSVLLFYPVFYRIKIQ